MYDLSRANGVLAGAVLLAVISAVPRPALAVLGEAGASAQDDAARFGAAHSLSTARGLSTGSATASAPAAAEVHVLALPDGSSIREYALPGGRVFAVVWNTRNKPRLDRLLGTHFAAYAAAGQEAMQRRPGVLHGARLQRGDLVVEATAHLNAHVGRAWLRSQLPSGVSTDALR